MCFISSYIMQGILTHANAILWHFFKLCTLYLLCFPVSLTYFLVPFYSYFYLKKFLFSEAHVSILHSLTPVRDSPIQLPRMVEKIFFLLASSISVKDSKLKWRVKRWVMGFRPPPGGPMAQAKLMSTMCLNVPAEKGQENKRETQSN